MKERTAACCSVHTHSTLCDGKNTLAEMAAAACAAGVRYFGASGHSHTPIPEDVGNVLPADLSAYQKQVLALRCAYAGRMEVLAGIEQDSCTESPVPDWAEYWIGSVHNLCDGETGCYYALDWDARRFARCRDELFRGDTLALVGRYYADVAAMAARHPTILGHVDLITKLNGAGTFFDEEDKTYQALALEALHAADPLHTLLEINTGAMTRGYRKTPYPAQFLLREWREAGGQVILTSDAHSADAVLSGYDDAAAWARAAGFRETAILTAAGRVCCSL